MPERGREGSGGVAGRGEAMPPPHLNGALQPLNYNASESDGFCFPTCVQGTCMSNFLFP